MNPIQLKQTQIVKATAYAFGFDFCGISKADFLNNEAPKLEKWLLQQQHGKMQYMENYFDKRLDPRLLVEGSKSVISLAYNYHTTDCQVPDAPKVAQYAFGEDYHFVLKRKLKQLYSTLKEQIGDFQARVFVDSAPILEKAWAAKSGLGWIGKNSNLITKQQGSYFFLAEIICDLELVPDGPIKDYCGSCTRCIDACPTHAIKPYTVDASQCISYLTIELRDAIPDAFKSQMENYVFGCDICQIVCPWNRFSTPHSDTDLKAKTPWLSADKQAWKEITEEIFNDWFKNSPLKRAGYKGIHKNLKFLGIVP